MNAKGKPARDWGDNERRVDDEEEIVNDSLGTTTLADSSGVDEEKETGDAKDQNFPTRED